MPSEYDSLDAVLLRALFSYLDLVLHDMPLSLHYGVDIAYSVMNWGKYSLVM